MREWATLARGALTATVGIGLLASTALILAPRPGAAQKSLRLPYRDASLPVDARVRDLLGRMTPEEMFWQLFMIPGNLDDPAHDYSHGVFGLQIRTTPGASGSAARVDAERINATQRVDAVIDAWYPGEQGGRAVADVIFGGANPAGRLPITFPIAEGQLPLRYDDKPTGRGDDYVDLTGQPLFPFGFGPSYTTFEYADLRIVPDGIGPSDTATVRFTVKNTGARAGHEVAQLYLREALASVARPVLALRGFRRVHLEPGEAREVEFELGPDDLGLYDEGLTWAVEPGTFVVMIGASSKDIRLRGELAIR